jgi:hypothetical protein
MSNKSALKRRLTLGRCQYCERNFFSDKRTGRPRLFCDKKCRDGDFRRLRYLTLKNVEPPKKPKSNQRLSDPILPIDP